MECNIDARGKAFRLMIGLCTLAAAAVIAVVTGLGLLPAWCWWLAGGAAAGGGFAVFEGWKGWCAARAMGLRTPF
jgi:hypothetical protein